MKESQISAGKTADRDGIFSHLTLELRIILTKPCDCGKVNKTVLVRFFLLSESGLIEVCVTMSKQGN